MIIEYDKPQEVSPVILSSLTVGEVFVVANALQANGFDGLSLYMCTGPGYGQYSDTVYVGSIRLNDGKFVPLAKELEVYPVHSKVVVTGLK